MVCALLSKAKMPSLLSVLPLHLTMEKSFWSCSCSSQGILWNHFLGWVFFPFSHYECKYFPIHHSILLSSAEHWGRTVQSDFLHKLECTSSVGSYLQWSSRPNAQQLHFMKVVVEILLKHWQVWDFAHLSSKPIPVFVHPLSKEMLPNVKSSSAWRAVEGKVWYLPTGYSLLVPTYETKDGSWNMCCLGRPFPVE